MYEYSYRFLSILAALSISSILPVFILVVFFAEIRFEGNCCTFSFPLWLTGYTAFVDISQQIILIYLFVIPLVLIERRMSDEQSSNNTDFRKFALKYYILGLTASISTLLIMLTIPITGTVLFVPI